MRSPLISLIASALVVAACAHRAPPQPPPPMVFPLDQPIAPEAMAWAIESTLAAKRCPVLERAPGRIRAQIISHRVYATVDLYYHAQAVQIAWVDGNLSPSSDRFARWTRGMGVAIQRRAWRMASGGVPQPAAVPNNAVPPPASAPATGESAESPDPDVWPDVDGPSSGNAPGASGALPPPV